MGLMARMIIRDLPLQSVLLSLQSSTMRMKMKRRMMRYCLYYATGADREQWLRLKRTGKTLYPLYHENKTREQWLRLMKMNLGLWSHLGSVRDSPLNPTPTLPCLH
jgi:hypothetical protein